MDERDDEAVRTVADLVRRAARRDPGHPALVAEAATVGWGELDDRVDRAVAALTSPVGLGLARGDRLALQLGNSLDFPVMYLAALRAGLVAVPTNPGYTTPELVTQLADSGARALVTSSVAAISDVARVRAGAPALDTVLVAAPSGPDGTVALPGLLAAAPAPRQAGDARPGPDELAVLLYTSGTSGPPRGAMLSHRALLANLDQCTRFARPPSSRRPTCCCWPYRSSVSTG